MERLNFVTTFGALLNSVPSEITRRINGLEALYEDTNISEFDDMITELKAWRKSYFYRRKKYRERADGDEEEEVAKYMTFIHDTALKFMGDDARVNEIMSRDE